MNWNLDRARSTYNVAHWGGGYFDINQQGHLVVYPDRDNSKPGIDVYALSQRLAEQKLSLPVLLRFTDILRDRVTALCNAFDLAMEADNYAGGYTAVYPIKVNQQRTVVEHICQNGGGRIGLEAGSKPELMAVLALSSPGGVIVCNGYKDREYIRLALIGQRLGHKVFIVIEKPSEVQLVLDESAKLGIEPMLGVRVRLASIGAGKWQNTGGEKSKFGLTSSQVLALVGQLRQADKVETLQLLHCHLGSQIANIRDIQGGMREVARYYAELYGLNVALEYVDVGGGLGVDYEGTRSRSYCSMNYSVQEYANNVVHALKLVCEEKDLPQPMIISESGRALTAHHAVLITNVIDSDVIELPVDVDALNNSDDPKVIHYLWNVMSQSEIGSPLEVYHDAVHWLQQAQDMYIQGVMSLEQRSRAEQLYYVVSVRVKARLNPAIRAQRELLDELNEKQADKYFCNFSLFQSLPDVWAIDQVFPIMPLHRLNEEPTRRVVIQDLTCDSDGRIDHYVDNEGLEASLPLHQYSSNKPYLLGMMLVGAYQETLGDMHNLFGDTDSVDVELTKDGYQMVSPEYGDAVDELLAYVHFDADGLLASYETKLNASEIPGQDKGLYLDELRAGLKGYTYHED